MCTSLHTWAFSEPCQTLGSGHICFDHHTGPTQNLPGRPSTGAPKLLTNSAQLSGPPVKHSLWGEPALGQPQQASGVSVPLTSFSEAQGGPGVRLGKARHTGTGGWVLL